MVADIKVVLVDDRERVRLGLARILNQVPGIQVVAEAAAVSELPHVLTDSPANVVLLDLAQADLGAEAMLRELAVLAPALKRVVISPAADAAHRQALFQAGAHALLAKSCHVEEVVLAIETVFRGEVYQPLGATPHYA